MLRPETSNDLFIILVVICLTLIALAKLFFEKRFYQFVAIFISPSYLKIHTKNQNFIDFFDGLLFVNLLISSSIFSFIAYTTYYENQVFTAISIYKIGFFIGAFIISKVLLERLIGSLFSIDSIINNYLFQKTSYKLFIGLILIPINIIFLFSLTPNMYLVIGVIILIILINIIGLLTSYKSNLNLIKGALFYFILYLCALEIGPYIILYKVLIETKS